MSFLKEVRKIKRITIGNTATLVHLRSGYLFASIFIKYRSITYSLVTLNGQNTSYGTRGRPGKHSTSTQHVPLWYSAGHKEAGRESPR